MMQEDGPFPDLETLKISQNKNNTRLNSNFYSIEIKWTPKSSCFEGMIFSATVFWGEALGITGS